MSIAGDKLRRTKVLAIDTSTNLGSVALLEGTEIRAGLRIASSETHSSRLLRGIEFLLAHISWSLRDLGLVAAGIGPGSFTGIRIGVSSALGLAQPLDIPFAGVSCLDAAASLASCVTGRLGVVMDARRDQVYYSEYTSGQGRVRRMGRPTLCSPAELGRRLRRNRIHLIGDALVRYRADLGIRDGTRWPRLVEADLFLAEQIGRLALRNRRLWRSGDFLVAEPLYIRPPDAVRPAAGFR